MNNQINKIYRCLIMIILHKKKCNHKIQLSRALLSNYHSNKFRRRSSIISKINNNSSNNNNLILVIILEYRLDLH